MKRTIKIMAAGLAGTAALLSCTKDNVPTKADEPLFKGDRAYMTVIIKDTGSATRASSPDDRFDYGTDEQTVGGATFYFYDHLGEFVTQAEVWSGGVPSTGGSSETAGNIEFRGKTVMALENLSGKTYPMYMVTVLNRPAGFKPGESLKEMIRLLSIPDVPNGGIRNSVGNFVMSTTSFAGQKGSDGSDLPYYVTEVKAENFASDPGDLEGSNPVVVYVERLAAKVGLNVREGLDNERTVGGRTMYLIHVTVAGDPNAADGEQADDASESLYVELLGWKLNATAKYSYMLKNIDEKWANTETSLGEDWVWNDPANFRSYWAKSYNYAKGGYPGTSGGATDGTQINGYLNYYSLADNLVELGGAAYCAENTNTAGSGDGALIKSRHSPALTSAVVKARLCDSEGRPHGDLVRYENVLWEPAHYMDYVLNALTDAGSLNAYYDSGQTEDGTGAMIYRQIDSNCVELRNGFDGAVNVALTEAAKGMTFYQMDSEGAVSSVTADVGGIEEALDSFNSTSGAIGYKDGLMYYNIPIEHLNDRYDYTDADGAPEIREGNFGVVRNHSYRVTITKIDAVGKGIFDENEVLVPTEDLESYYVGAQVNILSWKLVDQDVEL